MHRDAVGGDLLVVRDHHEILDAGLRGDHAIERVTMEGRQPTGRDRVRALIGSSRKRGCSGGYPTIPAGETPVYFSAASACEVAIRVAGGKPPCARISSRHSNTICGCPRAQTSPGQAEEIAELLVVIVEVRSNLDLTARCPGLRGNAAAS